MQLELTNTLTRTQQTTTQPERVNAARQSAVQVGLVTLALMITLVVAVLIRFEGDPMDFVNTGERFTQGDPRARAGADGQFYYYIATEGASAGALAKMDFPASFRYQRIFYPALAATISLWQPALVPWAMIGINVVSAAVFTGLLAYTLRLRSRMSPWYALLGGLWMGSMLSVRFVMAEPLALALGMLAVVLYVHNRFIWVIVLAGITALTKEVGLILIGGLILHTLWQRQWLKSLSLAAGALIPYLLWAWVIGQWLRIGISDTQSFRQFSLIPFGGIAGSFNLVFVIFGILWLFIPAAIFGLLIAKKVLRHADRQVMPVEMFICLAAVVFVVVIPSGTFEDLPSAVRYAQPLIIGALLYTAQQFPRRAFWLVGLWGPSILLGVLVAFSTYQS